MEKIDLSYLDKFRPRADEKTGRPRSQRDELLDKFTARLNASRIADGYPKLTHARVAKMLAGRDEPELYRLYSRCETYRSFGAGLHYELKPKA